jgi:hypothetical protein
VSVGLRGLPIRARSMRPGGGLDMSMRTRRFRIDVIPGCGVFRASFPCGDEAAGAAAASVSENIGHAVRFRDHLIAGVVVGPGILPLQHKSWENADNTGQIEAPARENLTLFARIEIDGGKLAVNPAV